MLQMSDKIYIDTNIWVYLYSDEKRKSKKSEELIKTNFNQIIISTQVLNELFNVLVFKLKIKTKEETRQIVSDLINSFDTVLISSATIVKAIDISIKYQYRFYDSLMLAIALQNQCNIFYSEDLQDGQILEEQLTIINPLK